MSTTPYIYAMPNGQAQAWAINKIANQLYWENQDHLELEGYRDVIELSKQTQRRDRFLEKMGIDQYYGFGNCVRLCSDDWYLNGATESTLDTFKSFFEPIGLDTSCLFTSEKPFHKGEWQSLDAIVDTWDKLRSEVIWSLGWISEQIEQKRLPYQYNIQLPLDVEGYQEYLSDNLLETKKFRKFLKKARRDHTRLFLVWG